MHASTNQLQNGFWFGKLRSLAIRADDLASAAEKLPRAICMHAHPQHSHRRHSSTVYSTTTSYKKLKCTEPTKQPSHWLWCIACLPAAPSCGCAWPPLLRSVLRGCDDVHRVCRDGSISILTLSRQPLQRVINANRAEQTGLQPPGHRTTGITFNAVMSDQPRAR